MFFQLSDGGEGIDGVSGKTRDRFGDDKVYFSVKGVFDHAFEAFSLFGIGTGDPFVGVDTRKLPVISGFNVICVVVYLCLVAGKLLIGVR